VIHRDLKMSNLLLLRGELKLCDFGLAREHSFPRAEAAATAAYTPMVVTLWYRAPELLLGEARYGTPIDLWSIGCIMGELLLHKPLLPGSSEIKQLGLICGLLGTPSPRIWPGISDLALWPKLQAGLPEQPYNELPSALAKARPSETTLELMNAFLTFDPSMRITAAAAFTHSWFCRDGPQPARCISCTASTRGAKRARGDGDAPLPSNGRLTMVASSRLAVESAAHGLGDAEGVDMRTSARARIPSPEEVMATSARQC
jgi:serine/threonine protein kinase